MPDMLVKLYELPDALPYREALREKGIQIRRAIAPEKSVVCEWVEQNFSKAWSDECEAAFSQQPVTCYIAQKGEELIGFACYDATCKAFFGPTGVSPDSRKLGVGASLLVESLTAMAYDGYAYGIIGGAGPVDFYARIVGAIPIEGSIPGIYRNMLRHK